MHCFRNQQQGSFSRSHLRVHVAGSCWQNRLVDLRQPRQQLRHNGRVVGRKLVDYFRINSRHCLRNSQQREGSLYDPYMSFTCTSCCSKGSTARLYSTIVVALATGGGGGGGGGPGAAPVVPLVQSALCVLQ